MVPDTLMRKVINLPLEWNYRPELDMHWAFGKGWRELRATQVGPASFYVSEDSVQGNPRDHYRVQDAVMHGTVEDAKALAQQWFDAS